jgi:hypothetical protein
VRSPKASFEFAPFNSRKQQKKRKKERKKERKKKLNKIEERKATAQPVSPFLFHAKAKAGTAEPVAYCLIIISSALAHGRFAVVYINSLPRSWPLSLSFSHSLSFSLSLSHLTE